jgi:cysteine-rich repeat protein
VLGRGRIVTVVDDEIDECPHEGPGVRLAPFFDSLTSRYRAELLPADGDPIPIASIDFTVGMIPDEGGVCGNGELEPPEQCDDGNLDAGDGCDAFCAAEYAPVCGDGVVDFGESCDDGNTMCMDGCDERCRIEPPGEPGSSDDEE